MEIDIYGEYGPEVKIDNCILGPNLNLSAIRGFARIDVLAAISAPDVFNQKHNPHGTQRDLKKKHSTEAFDYALEASQVTADESPRAFTEVILNIRDRNVVSIFEAGEEIEYRSTDDVRDIRSVSVLVDLDAINFPQPEVNPQISRLDGNHRLSAVFSSEDILDERESLPVVPFCLFVGLTIDQERALFRDINGNQMKMETAHLDTITLKLTDTKDLLADEDIGKTALWVAHELTSPGRAFEDLIFFGGNKKGLKQANRQMPPLKISALRDSVKMTITGSKELENNFFVRNVMRDELLTPEQIDEERLLKARQFVVLLDRYWVAVRNAFPQAWQDKKNYILLQSIGLYAFSWLAGVVIPKQIVEQRYNQADFDLVLANLAKKVDIRKENPHWEGRAGMAGARVVYKALEDSLDYQAVAYDKLKELDPPAAGPLD